MRADASPSLDRLVTALVPTLSRSLAERFNVFRVMHHGTHEKQLSNVFAWLLRVDGTHELGDVFQRIFVDHVNRQLPAERQVPVTGYLVAQEVDTSGIDEGGDIADIVLSGETASIVVENYEWSDGHGHSYDRYQARGAAGGRQGVVVLLCARRMNHLLTHGWDRAVVITYAEVLADLAEHLERDHAWRRSHPRQDVFIRELVEQFTEGPAAVGVEDRIAFIKAMCDTGESDRYGYRPQERAAREFADVVALHAREQFEEGRRTLGEIKRALLAYASHTLISQVSPRLLGGSVHAVESRFVGQWEWCVTLRRPDPVSNLYLEFGPTAVVENRRVAEPVADPDYSKVFVTRQTLGGGDGVDQIAQTAVSLEEVLAGLSAEDTRLRDAVLDVAAR
jgi:hypothetical protein